MTVTSALTSTASPEENGSGMEIPPDMAEHAIQAAAFMKALAHEGRLMILCHLVSGEKSVTELEKLLGQRQAAVSQQLARLRMEGLVEHRRDGKTIFYSIGDPKVQQMLGLLYNLFCAPDRPEA